MPSVMSQSASLLMGSALRRLREEGERYFEPARIDFEPVQPAHVSRVLQVRVRNSARPCGVFIKSYMPADESPESLRSARERLQREYAALVKLHEIASRHPGLSVNRPIACFPEELCIVTEQVPGVTLRSLLRGRKPWHSPETWTMNLLPVFRSLGNWIRMFQECGPSGRQLSLQDMENYLESRLQMLQRHLQKRFQASDRISILRHYERLSREVEAKDLAEVGVHADFCPDNVLVNSTGITVIDFEMAHTGAMYADVSHLYMHIDNLKAKPWIGRGVVQRCQEALLRGYNPALDPSRPMFQLCLLINTVCHFAHVATRELSIRDMAFERYLWKNRWQWLKSLGN